MYLIIGAAALVAAANRAAGSFGGRGRVALGLASVALAFVLGAGWWSVAAGAAAILWRALPTGFAWRAAHPEAHAAGFDPVDLAKGVAASSVGAALALAPLAFALHRRLDPSDLLIVAIIAAGWAIGIAAYSAVGRTFGWRAASAANPTEWVMGAALAAAVFVAVR